MADTTFAVFSDLRGRLGIWPARMLQPPGWSATGHQGSRQECVGYAAAHRGDARPAPTSSGRTMVSLFRDARAAHPDRIAVSDGERTVTYAELDAWAAQIAEALRGQGVAPGHRVLVCLPRGVEVFAAILGILSAGAAYVPVDQFHPGERRLHMRRVSGAEVAIGDPSDPAWQTDPALRVFTVPPAVTGTPTSPSGPEPTVDVDGLAAVLFTSGSSGQPKAVGLSHANLVHFADNPGLPTLSSTDRVAHVSSMSFDAFHFETWCAIAVGAEIAVLPRMPDLIGRDIARELRRRRITVMLVPTMAFHHVLREDRETFASLRVLCTGGDVLSSSAARDLLSSSFSGEFYNLYGPTEATTACTIHRVTEVPDDALTVPIGVALDGCHVDILDESLDPVPDGVVGELHVGGPGVATEAYLGRPDLTVEKFLPDPHRTGGRRYATGDRGYRRPDGSIEFAGRVDDQVKIRGYRVEPAEVQRVVDGHPDVRDAAVVVTGDDENRRLMAFVVAGGELSARALRSWLQDRLPEHLVPSALLRVSELPSTGHGKRDLAALRAQAEQHAGRQAAHVPPTTVTECYLAEVWEDLLHVERIGANDDFFELGGNSLLAFRAQRRIGRDLGISINARDVLSTSRLQDLADLIRQRQEVGA